MYFKNIPTIAYDMGSFKKICKNILVCAKFNDFFKGTSEEQLFVEYTVRDGESAEEIANRVYGSPLLHWVILLFNNIKNPYLECPLSQAEMESQLYKTYPGSAIFVDLTDRFRKTNGVYLLPKKSHFVPGEVVAHENGYWTGIVSKWDPTLRKVEIDGIEGIFDANTPTTYSGKIISSNEDGFEFEATMNRVVFDNTYALHHFEDNDGNFIDPYEDFIGRNINRTSLTTDALQGDFILKRYIEESYDTDVMVNRAYEDKVNDDRRKIKLLKIEYVQQAIDTYIGIFNG